MIRVLMVEDSITMATMLRACLTSVDDIEVIGHAKDGLEAVRLATELKPDLITMDVVLPELSGVEATRLIMTQNPIPIVVISSYVNDSEMRVSFDSLNAGAVAVLEKPSGAADGDFEKTSAKIVSTVRAMSSIKLVRRRAAKGSQAASQPEAANSLPCEVVAVGVSTGGPNALTQILGDLPGEFPAPVLVTQHISQGFTVGFAQWLDGVTDLAVHVAGDGDLCLPGHVYVAPDDRHLLVSRGEKGLHIKLRKSPPLNGFRPSASAMFESVAQVAGPSSVGVILTGMGRDGADGLLSIKKRGGHTIGQGPASSVVYGMSAVAKEAGAVTTEKELDEIGPYLAATVEAATA